MDNNLKKILDESIRLELNIAELYRIFYQTLKKDSKLWSELIDEEENHAALIKNIASTDILPEAIIVGILSPSLEAIQEANKTIKSYIVDYTTNPPSRDTAFNVALEIEQSAGEIHFQKFMENELKDPFVQLFQRLNADDKDHIVRLHHYMEQHDIKITK